MESYIKENFLERNSRKIHFLSISVMILLFASITIILRESFPVLVGGAGIVIIFSTEIIPRKITDKIKKAISH